MPHQVVNALEAKATAAESLDEAEYNYRATVGAMPGAVQERLASPAKEVRVEVSTQPAWCLCEMPEGDYSRVRVFSDLENLVNHIGRLEGEEVSVWAFYGTPLRLTRPDGTGQRYLLVSDQEVVIVPKGSDSMLQFAENPTLPEVQEDGWLGDEAFTQGNAENYYAYGAPKDDQFDDAGDAEEED